MTLGTRARRITFWFGETVICAVFATMARASWYVLRVMAGETLVSLDWVSLKLTQSVVPIGCTFFVVAHGLSTPDALVLVTSCSIARTEIRATTRTNLPFIAVLFALLMVVTYVPIVPMGLVELFYR